MDNTVSSLRQILSSDEIKTYTKRSNLKGLQAVFTDLILIIGILAIVGHYPNPFTIVFAVFLLGARQMGLGVVMHDCSHKSMFSSQKLNQLIGSWAGHLIVQDIESYRKYHLAHHKSTGNEKDPDLPLYQGYPITLRSALRKLIRDLTGVTGLRFWSNHLLMRIGILCYNISGSSQVHFVKRPWREVMALMVKRLGKAFLANTVLLSICVLFGNPWAYVLWPIALMTTFMVVMRLRSVAEHALVPDIHNPMSNARTICPRWWERLFIAPHNISYHFEHHLLMAAPYYKLPALHRRLAERGAIHPGCVAYGYINLLRHLFIKGSTT